LEWTFKYYTEGCIDWRWHYKYDYAPLLKDLIQFIPYVDEEFLTKKAPDPVHKYVQLGYVLPRKSLNLLPPDLYKTLITEHSDLYRLDCEFKWSFCKYFWESHVVMPAIDIDLLERVIAV
jgi:5'-3' exoribonuclease 2